MLSGERGTTEAFCVPQADKNNADIKAALMIDLFMIETFCCEYFCKYKE
jgi:hypothetical protein